MTTLSLQISGMSCGHCVKAVERALHALPGVTVEHVAVGSATLRFDDATTDPARIAAAVEDAGYAVTASA